LKPVRKRKLVDEMRGDWNVSIGRACRVLPVDTYTYLTGPSNNGSRRFARRESAMAIAAFTCCCGVKAEGRSLGQNKTRRIYRELGLQLRSKTPKRRVEAKLCNDRRVATQPNETWAMDFVHDQLATGRKMRVPMNGGQIGEQVTDHSDTTLLAAIIPIKHWSECCTHSW
jgi:putative transposase